MPSLKTLKTFCGVAAVVLVLSGCGGGSGSSSPAASASSTSSGPTSSSGSTGSTTGSSSSSSGSSGSTTTSNKGQATLAWSAPTANSDGTALTDLAGYHIYYGNSPGSLSNVVDISSPSTLTYVVTSLGTGTWYFAIAAYTNTGAESPMSNVGSKTIS